MKVVLHGFGTFPVLYRHLIAEARVIAPEISWAIILPTVHHLEMMREVLDAADILSLEDLLPRHFSVEGLDDLANYDGNLFVDLGAEKRHFKFAPPGQEQVGRALATYRIYRDFLRRIAPTHIFIGQIESFEGKALVALARELGIRCAIPTPPRNLGGVYFSADAQETLPAYRAATRETTAAAERIVAEFQGRHIPAAGPPAPDYSAGEVLPDYRRSLVQRAGLFAKRAWRRPELIAAEVLRVAILNNLPPVARAIWGVRRHLNSSLFDIATPEALPERFVFYPLQYSPESSINTPAPYYVDQMRAIDAIRFSMPSHYTLVVKEHPAAIMIRPRRFIQALRRKAGVRVAHYKMPARELIRRADLTISVTGTATFEAFLLQRPSLTLGDCSFGPYLGGRCGVEDLPRRVREAMAHPPEADQVVQAVAELLSIRHDIAFRSPGAADAPPLTRAYVRSILDAYLRHTRLESDRLEVGV
jgi:hypothetical protein